MATNENRSDSIKYLEVLLSGTEPHLVEIPPDLENDLLRKGAILALQEDASMEAISLLGRLAQGAASSDIRNLALFALRRLADSGATAAADEIYQIAILDQQPAARQLALTARWKPGQPAIKALFDWLVAVEDGNEPNINLELLTEGFLAFATPSLQSAIFSRAAQTRYRNWAQMAVWFATPKDNLRKLIDLYPDLSQAEQEICRSYLEKLAQDHQEAQYVLCSLFIEHDDRDARDITIRKGYLPEQPYEKALYYFLIGNQNLYQQIDFNHNLLVTAYEASSRALRRRLLAFSRQTGQIDWLSAINQSNEVRWLADLSDRDWELAIRSLVSQERFAELWRLAQVAPPVWSAGILVRLHRSQWKPEDPGDQESFRSMANLAEICLRDALDIQPAKKLMALSDEVLSLALHPGGSLLAAGSSGQPIFLWHLPEGELHFPALIGPASSTRAIKFSLDGELIIAASSDQHVRLFRHKNSQLIKTLEGHRGLIRAMALHPNGRLLVTTSFDGAIHLWRFPMGTRFKSLVSQVKELFAAEFLANGDLLATGGAGDRVDIWKLPDGNRLRSIPVDPTGVLHLEATPASDLLAVAERTRRISIWNAVNGNLVHLLPELDAPVAGLHFHPNEQILISVSAKGMVNLWNLNSGSSLFSFETPHPSINATCLASDGQTLVTADGTGAIYLWNLASFVWLHTPYHPGISLPLDQLSRRMVDTAVSPAEITRLRFTETLWKWIRRYEIEIGEPMLIELGEFDIEL